MAIDVRRVALAALLACLPLQALAWGPAGHRIVAALAERELRPTTRAALQPLLARSHAHALADVATWADDLRDDRRRRALWHSTSRLHFVEFADAACRYDARRDCADGQCAVAAIDRYATVLGDRARSIDERAEALRMLVHLVADVHQPLHAGYRRDAGGNGYRIRGGRARGRATNLHALWDTPVLGVRRGGWRLRAAELARRPSPAATGRPADWAEESCRATRDAGVYPARHRVDPAYLERMRPLAERRLREAAMRLAALLERALESRR
ncbi:MAG TPA: S1/P1 nuclease [Dokdonella sp.]|nr:S1/P1 nuclease [Dokdonella sp.]